jgi:hypothetical protein
MPNFTNINQNFKPAPIVQKTVGQLYRVLQLSRFLFFPFPSRPCYPLPWRSKRHLSLQPIQQKKRQQKHTTGGIPRWSPTLVLVARFSAYVWQSGRDAQFSLTYGRMYSLNKKQTATTKIGIYCGHERIPRPAGGKTMKMRRRWTSPDMPDDDSDYFGRRQRW